ncbi:hypothetical protein [Terrisporobacter mayombei]|uniref:Uncharacterized protein n=1 Tax=Terrisporobacter mayombei TaxID=1541 RepID=A0ABY9PZ94_9FIRM|nr:hypothetical protein [Terrisporobacter mayombei]MCC3868500.1 hypothetical protein [Terrisporobacter mayombei]WMT80656.1 hypothetical protein TEMA_09770 [Terrisporobacter mayombei]
MKLPNGYEQGKGKEKLALTVKMTETDIFKAFFREYRIILEDERIDKSIRLEYNDRFNMIINETCDREVVKDGVKENILNE